MQCVSKRLVRAGKKTWTPRILLFGMGHEEEEYYSYWCTYPFTQHYDSFICYVIQRGSKSSLLGSISNALLRIVQ